MRMGVILDDDARRRLRLAAAVLNTSQGDIIRQGLSDRLRAIEERHPEVRRLLDA